MFQDPAQSLMRRSPCVRGNDAASSCAIYRHKCALLQGSLTPNALLSLRQPGSLRSRNTQRMCAQSFVYLLEGRWPHSGRKQLTSGNVPLQRRSKQQRQQWQPRGILCSFSLRRKNRQLSSAQPRSSWPHGQMQLQILRQQHFRLGMALQIAVHQLSKLSATWGIIQSAFLP